MPDRGLDEDGQDVVTIRVGRPVHPNLNKNASVPPGRIYPLVKHPSVVIMHDTITCLAGNDIERGDIVAIHNVDSSGLYIVKKVEDGTTFTIREPYWFERLWWWLKDAVLSAYPFLSNHPHWYV